MTFTHDSAGTGEPDWRDWLPTRSMPLLDVADTRSVVVVAAHPDDETLGAGGLMSQAARRGIPIMVVVATAGEASHPRSPTVSRATLAARRAREVLDAVAVLAPAAKSFLLALPDGRLSDARAQLTRCLEAVVTPGSWVAAPWRGDEHPDHLAAGIVAAKTAERAGAVLLEYPIWAWHWACPGDARLPWPSAQRLDLDESTTQQKASAMSAHHSQVSDLSDQPGDERLLSEAFLDHFRRASEVYFVTDYGKRSAPPLSLDGAGSTGSARQTATIRRRSPTAGAPSASGR